ncbi:MAG: AMP-binding protein [Actinomycetota bacterium]
MSGTISELFDAAVARSPSKVWLQFEDLIFTYEEAHAHIAAATSRLRDLGVQRETLVAATMRNSPAYLFTWLALMRLGAVLVPANPRSSAAELAGLVAQVRPALVVIDSELYGVFEQNDARIVAVDELEGRETSGVAPSAARPGDIAVMIPTSGTTGRSKLVMQTQRTYSMAGEGFPFWLGLTEEDRLMTSLPLFHINAPAYSVLGSVAACAGLVLLPRFSGAGFIDSARRYGATEFNAIGAMLEILMRQPERDNDADNPLRLCYTGPSPTEERQLEIERRFGLEIVCGYALSETPYALIWKKGTRPFGTLGSPRQHPTLGEINRARVMDKDREMSPGEEGELELNNPAVMAGYYGMPEETSAVLSNGWLKTGDLVRVNSDGTYTFVARKKEVIRRRGENLSPLEVEAVLEDHPAIAEAAVVGVPSELTEEDVKAFVVLDRKVSVSLSDLRDHAAAALAAYKVPRYFESMSKLPHTPTGRVAKHELSRERTESEEDFGARAEAGAERR